MSLGSSVTVNAYFSENFNGSGSVIFLMTHANGTTALSTSISGFVHGAQSVSFTPQYSGQWSVTAYASGVTYDSGPIPTGLDSSQASPVTLTVNSGADDICGNDEPTTAQMDVFLNSVLDWNNTTFPYSTPTREVPVYFHVIRSDSGTGGVTSSQITQSMSVLNSAFAGTQFSFVSYQANSIWNETITLADGSEIVREHLGGYEYVNNSDWVLDGFADPEMFRELSYDPGYVLNVYVNPDLPGAMGFGSIPLIYTQDTPDQSVLIESSTFPGGSKVGFNQGDTLVHEVGHYLGLFHTFKGGCNDTIGDGIDDTPRHDIPVALYKNKNYLPDPNTDSCPFVTGYDPIRNYMNYVQHAVMDEFTDDQEEAMHALTRSERPLLWESASPSLAPARLVSRPVYYYLQGSHQYNGQAIYMITGALVKVIGYNSSLADSVVVERRSVGQFNWGIYETYANNESFHVEEGYVYRVRFEIDGELTAASNSIFVDEYPYAVTQQGLDELLQ